MTLSTQWFTMLIMFGSGFLLGLLLDAYRVCKDIFQIRGWLLACIDLLYWLFSAYLVFGLLWWSNWGDVRFYIFIAVCLGFFIHFRLLSDRVSLILNRLIRSLVAIIGWMVHLIWLIFISPLIKILSVMRLTSLWLVIRVPKAVGKKFFSSLWQKNREKK